MSRLPDLPRDELPEAERRFYDAVKAIRRRPVSGPFIVLMNSSPDLAARCAHLGHYFHSRGQADEALLPLRARAFVSLVGARALDAPYEWAAWVNWALEAGVAQDTVDAIRERRTPPFTVEEALIATVCSQLVSGDHRVDAGTFEAALAHFGARQLVELVTTLGYFAMIALPLNAFEMEMTAQQKALRKPFAPLAVDDLPYTAAQVQERPLPPLQGKSGKPARVRLLAGHDDVARGDQHFLDRIVRTRGWTAPVFQVLLHSPDAAERISNVGAYLLYDAVLPPEVRALVCLVAARELDCEYTWRAGLAVGRASGVDEALVACIERGERPAAFDASTAAVFDFCRQLLRGNHHVDDETYRRMLGAHPIPVVVQVAAMLGYTAMMSLIANAFALVPPEGDAGPLL